MTADQSRTKTKVGAMRLFIRVYWLAFILAGAVRCRSVSETDHSTTYGVRGYHHRQQRHQHERLNRQERPFHHNVERLPHPHHHRAVLRRPSASKDDDSYSEEIVERSRRSTAMDPRPSDYDKDEVIYEVKKVLVKEKLDHLRYINEQILLDEAVNELRRLNALLGKLLIVHDEGERRFYTNTFDLCLAECSNWDKDCSNRCYARSSNPSAAANELDGRKTHMTQI